MAQHLAGALEKTIISEKLINRECIIDSIIPDLPYKGIIVFNESLEPIYYNEYQTMGHATRGDDQTSVSR